MKDLTKLINFRELSLLLTGNRETIRAKKIPTKYKKDVDKLVSVVDEYVKEITKLK